MTSIKEYLSTNKKEPVTQCLVCEKPLGAETRDMDIPLCHECRKCPKCGREVDSRSEIAYCLNNDYPVTHARCLSLSSKSLDLEIELMNISRLTFHPNPLISRETNSAELTSAFNAAVHLMKHDEILLIVSQAQALAAAGSLALSKNRREIEKEVSDREATNFKKSRDEATKNNQKPAEKKALSNDEKSIKMFMEMGIPRAQAEDMVKNQLKNMKKDMMR